MNFNNLPPAKAIEELDFKELLEGVKTLFKGFLKDENVELLESDDFLALLECLAYREMLLRARINEAIKSCLLPYATGSDLDNVASIYALTRLKGAKPSADVEFSLSAELANDVILPAGLILSSTNGDIARLKNDTRIVAGTLKANAKIELDEFITSSKAKCELIQTPLPFLTKAKQTSEFKGGASVESDERFRERCVLSLHRFSTAGARGGYIYQALSASVKVKEVAVLNGGAGVVNVYIKTPQLDEETRAQVETFLSADERRPLTDRVNVLNATKRSVVIRANIELIDIKEQASVNELIKSGESELALGVDLNLSYIYKRLHVNGVYRANISEPAADIIVSENEFVSFSFELSFSKARL